MPGVQAEHANGSRIAANEMSILPLRMGPERLFLDSAYFVRGLNLNIIFYSTLDEKGVTTTVNIGVCSLTDRRHGVVFVEIDKSARDGLFAKSLLPQLMQTVAGYGR